MANQHKSLNTLNVLPSVRDTYQVLLSVPAAGEDTTKKDFALVKADDLKAYILGDLPDAAGASDAPEATAVLTEDMFFTLRLTSTNGVKYWSVKPLLDALDTLQQNAKDEVAQEVKLQTLNQQVTQLGTALDNVTIKVTQLVQAASDPDAMFGPEARDYLDDHFLSRDMVMPYQSVVVGQRAGEYCGNLGASVLLGAGAGVGVLNTFKDYVAIGAYAQPLANKAVVLGNTRTQTYAPTSVATRADVRDFTDEQPLGLGLDFVLKLKPKLAVMDLREDYIAYGDMPYPPAPIEAEPTKPTVSLSDPNASNLWAAYRAEFAAWTVKNTAFHKAMDEWRPAYAAWKKANALSAIVPDGSQKRIATQSILLADDVIEAATQVGSFFTGVENSKTHGGMDIKSLRVEEMVPVLVKAIQELHALVRSDELVEAIAARLFEKQQAAREKPQSVL